MDFTANWKQWKTPVIQSLKTRLGKALHLIAHLQGWGRLLSVCYCWHQSGKTYLISNTTCTLSVTGQCIQLLIKLQEGRPLSVHTWLRTSHNTFLCLSVRHSLNHIKPSTLVELKTNKQEKGDNTKLCFNY